MSLGVHFQPTTIDKVEPAGLVYDMTDVLQTEGSRIREQGHRVFTRYMNRRMYTHYDCVNGTVTGEKRTVPISPKQRRLTYIVD